MINERDPEYTYVIDITTEKDSEYCKLLMYAVSQSSSKGESIRKEARYRFDALPQWMKDGIAVLDVAGPGVELEKFGVLSANIGSRRRYWFYSEQLGDLFKSEHNAPNPQA